MTWHYIFAKTNPRLLQYQRLTAHPDAATVEDQFEAIAPRIPKGSRARFRKLSRISLECNEAQAANRIRQTMAYIDLAFGNAAAAGRAMRVVVQATGIKIVE
jgi:hypothetical protein